MVVRFRLCLSNQKRKTEQIQRRIIFKIFNAILFHLSKKKKAKQIIVVGMNTKLVYYLFNNRIKK